MILVSDGKSLRIVLDPYTSGAQFSRLHCWQYIIEHLHFQG